MNVNETILDEITGDAVNIQRYEGTVQKQVIKQLKDLEGQIVSELKSSNVVDAVRKQTQDKRLKALLKKTRNTIAVAYKDIANSQLVILSEVAELSELQTVNALNTSIKSNISSPVMSQTMLKTIASDTLIEGSPTKEWWARKGAGFQAKFEDTIRMGMLQGQTTDNIVRSLIGTRVNKFKDGALEAQRRGAEAVVRSSIQTVANTARLDTYANNSDIIKGIEWSATFDNRTSVICMELDGLQWDMNYKPIGHSKPFPSAIAHWNCRSTQVPVTKSWEELGSKVKVEVPVGTRASMDGQVSGGQNYQQWLGTKSKAFQQEVLGVQKQKLWKAGKIGFSDLVNQRGHELTLLQLQNKIKPIPKIVTKARLKPKVPTSRVTEQTQPLIFNQRFKNKTPKEREKTWRKWDDDQEKTSISSREEAFHKWGTWHYPEFKAEFASGNLISNTAKSLDDTFKKYKGNHDGSTLYRGMVIENAENPQFIKYVNDLKVGDTLKDSTPLSFTKDFDIAKSYYKGDGDIIEGQDLSVLIKAKKVKQQGYDISDISNHLEEVEVVIKPNTKFKIIKITEDSSNVTGGYRNGEWVDNIKVKIIEVEVI